MLAYPVLWLAGLIFSAGFRNDYLDWLTLKDPFGFAFWKKNRWFGNASAFLFCAAAFIILFGNHFWAKILFRQFRIRLARPFVLDVCVPVQRGLTRSTPTTQIIQKAHRTCIHAHHGYGNALQILAMHVGCHFRNSPKRISDWTTTGLDNSEKQKRRLTNLLFGLSFRRNHFASLSIP